MMIDDQQVWTQVFESAKRFSAPRPALFLDRDGVIVEEVHYLHKPEDVRLISGAADVIATANGLGIPVIVVTNQSGLARDMFSWSDFAVVQEKMLSLLAEETGAFVDAVYASPYHKNGINPYCHPDHESRKPNAGMLWRAQKALPLDLSKSWIVGDKSSDLKAGLNAGLCGGMQVLTGHGSDEGQREKSIALATDGFEVLLSDSLADGIDRLSRLWAA